MIDFLRIYYERGNGRAVLDTGPGTQRMEAANVRMEGSFTTDRGEGPPRFWVVGKRCVVRIIDDVAYVSSLGEKHERASATIRQPGPAQH